MAGLRKAKKYDWKDSNLALFGSDTEKQVKKESAECEKAWTVVQNVGDGPATVVFRIVQFKVELWPKEEYGKFYSGDSYIIYNQKPKPDQPDVLEMHIHFWIGKESTQDEYGTAAYKTVELDTLLDDKPIQHREVQHHESDLFKSYFQHITYLNGGAESGFRHVKPTEYKPRFFKVARDDNTKKISVTQISRSRSSLNNGDVFILDNGLNFFQFNGSKCSNDERFRAAQYLQSIIASRPGKMSKEILDEDDTEANHPFYRLLDDGDDEEADDDQDDSDGANFTPTLFQLSDEAGDLRFTEVKSGSVSLHDFQSQDVFIYDTGCQLFVWVGGGASDAEKKNGFGYAQRYLMKTQHPFIPVTVVKQGKESDQFLAALC